MAGTLLCTTPVFPLIQDCHSSSSGVLSLCLPTQHRAACSCPVGAGCGISTGLQMALLGLLGDTKGTKPSLNPATIPLHSV